MTGYTINNRGRYKCRFCDHPTYKTMSGVLTHVQERHELELANATIEEMRAKLAEKPKVEVREKVVYKDKPEPKYWYIENGGGIYCSTCKIVQMRVGIPQGQTIENTPHNCGNRTLHLVLEVR